MYQWIINLINIGEKNSADCHEADLNLKIGGIKDRAIVRKRVLGSEKCREI